MAYQQFGPLAAMMHVQQQGELGRQRGEQSRLARLVSQGMSEPGGLSKVAPEVASFNPEAAFALEDRASAQMEMRRKELSGRARILSAMPPQQRAQVWPSMKAELAQIDPELGGALPDMYDDEQFAPLINELAGLGGNQAKVQRTFVGDDGQMYAVMNDGRVSPLGVGADRRTQLVDVPGVGPQLVDLRQGVASTVTAGGAPRREFQVTPGEVPFPTDPAEAEAARRAMVEGGTFRVEGGQVLPGASGGRQRTLADTPINDYGGGPVAAPAWVRPDSRTASEQKAPAGYRFRADGSLEPIPGGPADKPSEAKPLPVGALRLQLDATEALSVAEGVDELLAGYEKQIEDGTLDIGPIKNMANEARNFFGQSNESSQAFASFQAGLEKLRNDSLRLNKGVQTDGDAQRAWNELMANINDPGVVKARLKEIRQINARGVRLQQEKLQAIERNYQGGGQSSAPEDDIDALLAEFGS